MQMPAATTITVLVVIGIIGFVVLSLIWKAMKAMLQVLLLYGVVIATTIYQFVFNLLSNQGLIEAAYNAGIGFGLIIPTAAYDALIPTDFGAVAIAVLWFWLIVLVSTFYQTRVGPFTSVLDIFGRWRAFGAFALGTAIWWAFGLGLPNLSTWMSEQIHLTWYPVYWILLVFFIGGLIAIIEVKSRVKLLNEVPFNLYEAVKDIKRAIIG